MSSSISKEKLFSHSGIDVKFKTQAGRQDRRHLVVVFSGFCPLGRYNFDGTVADGCRFDILWIKDEFDGNNCYYMCKDMEFDIENAVISLIRSELLRLELSIEDCTLMGYSKGGTAAIFYGVKYGFKNIVASGPQMHFGSFSRENFNSSFRHMTSSGSDFEVAQLDSILPNILNSNDDYDKNIYIVSSSKDQFHEAEVVPYLDQFRLFQNFNLIMTESYLVPEHKVLGAYNTPLILSLLYSLGEGLVPKYLESVNGGRRRGNSEELESNYIRGLRTSREAVATLDRVSMKTGRIYPEGAAFIKGFEQSGFGKKKVALRLTSKNDTHAYPLGSVRDLTYSSRFYDRYFCDYFAAGYKSLDSAGIGLEELSFGVYTVFLDLEIEGGRYDIGLAAPKRLSFSHFHGDAYYYWTSDITGCRLIKRPLVGQELQSTDFELRRFGVESDRLYIEGVFAVPGVSASNYDHDRYSLVLSHEDKVIRLPLAQGSRAYISDRVDSGYNDYSKAYFATPKYEGLALSDLGLEPGTYQCHVSWFNEGFAMSHRLESSLEVSVGGAVFIKRSVFSQIVTGSRRVIKAVRRRMK